MIHCWGTGGDFFLPPVVHTASLNLVVEQLRLPASTGGGKKNKTAKTERKKERKEESKKERKRKERKNFWPWQYLRLLQDSCYLWPTQNWPMVCYQLSWAQFWFSSFCFWFWFWCFWFWFWFWFCSWFWFWFRFWFCFAQKTFNTNVTVPLCLEPFLKKTDPTTPGKQKEQSHSVAAKASAA